MFLKREKDVYAIKFKIRIFQKGTLDKFISRRTKEFNLNSYVAFAFIYLGNFVEDVLLLRKSKVKFYKFIL